MLRLRDRVLIAVKVVSDEDLDGLKVAEFVELLTQFLRLAIMLMLAVVHVAGALDRLADRIWDAYDALVFSLRWRLCPVRVAPIG